FQYGPCCTPRGRIVPPLGGERPPRKPHFESLYEPPLQVCVALPSGDEIGHHCPDGRAAPQGVQQQIDERWPEEAGLEERRAPQFGERLVADLLDVGGQRVAAARQHVGNPPSRREREENAFTRDRIDEARGVADERPPLAGERQPVEVANRQRRYRPRVRRQARAIPE